MTQHKWHKEIKAWADGAEIEFSYFSENGVDVWREADAPLWNCGEGYIYRIKPQPKEPQYLYVWFEPNYGKSYITASKSHNGVPVGYLYIGKIKLEVDDD